MARERSFATEADLCAHFLSGVDTALWTAYPESCGFDIILVRKSDGFQIGIEAKLKLGPHVITQCLESSGHSEYPGPDCRAVMIPYGELGHYKVICEYLGLTVIRVHTPANDDGPWRRELFYPYLPKDGSEWTSREWYEWAPKTRMVLPEYVPDVVAGAPAPVQLTDWKISAIKIQITMEKRGYLTRADFVAYKIDHRRWTAGSASGSGWLTVKDGRYTKGVYFPDFKKQHPVVYKQIKADSKKWMVTDGGK